MADIKILMVGGRRCGKSTVLASMYDQLLNNPKLTDNFFVDHKNDSQSASVSLNEKHDHLLSFIEQHKKQCYYLVDFDYDDSFSSYSFKVYKPRTFGNISFEFIDCPGETFCDNARTDLSSRLKKEIPDTDIFVIVVDTPYLMETGQGKSDRGRFRRVNLSQEITSFFNDEIKFKEDWTYKKVIFVPVKCERWADNLDSVSEKLKDFYAPLINRLNSLPQFSYSIIPALTAGGIVFQEFSEPKLYQMKKCARLGKSVTLRYSDGTLGNMEPGDELVSNNEYTDINPGFPLYSWFQNIGVYKPKNCDQLLFHILRFVVFKVMVNQVHSFLPGWMKGLPSVNAMKKMISSLYGDPTKKDSVMLKDSGDGIINLRKIENI